MGGSAGGGGRRATRALRLLLLLVLALAAVEFLFGSILDASPLRTYLRTDTQGYNATQPTIRLEKDKPQTQAQWPKQSPLLSLINSTRLKNFTKESRESQSANRNITVVKNNTAVTNFNVTITTNVTDHNMEKVENLQKQNLTVNNNITVSESSATSPSSVWLAQLAGSIKSVTIPEATAMPLCDNNPPDLGPIQVNKTDLELDIVEKRFPEVHWGGRYFPPNCTARHKVAIIVPYRDRQQHLAIFLNHMHPFLIKQQIEYGIFIIEQEGRKEFNRAKLMNVGFAEAQRLKAGGWQCFIFHDIDLLPLDTRNIYSCPRQPRHMSASIDKWDFKLPYEDIFGGVSAVTVEQFTKVNGFSNKYWGWGGEDDDMFYRLKKQNYHLARYKMSIARYAMLDHKKSVPNPKRYQLLSQTSKTFQKDGLSTLEYELVQVRQFHLYTHVLVNIDERS